MPHKAWKRHGFSVLTNPNFVHPSPVHDCGSNYTNNLHYARQESHMGQAIRQGLRVCATREPPGLGMMVDKEPGVKLAGALCIAKQELGVVTFEAVSVFTDLTIWYELDYGIGDVFLNERHKGAALFRLTRMKRVPTSYTSREITNPSALHNPIIKTPKSHSLFSQPPSVPPSHPHQHSTSPIQTQHGLCHSSNS